MQPTSTVGWAECNDAQHIGAQNVEVCYLTPPNDIKNRRWETEGQFFYGAGIISTLERYFRSVLMLNRAELETQLVNEIHYLPIEAVETTTTCSTLECCCIKKYDPTR